MASFRKRANGRWQAQVRRRGSALESATFDTKTAALRWARRIEGEIDEGRALGRGRVTGTVGQLLDRYELASTKARPWGRSKHGVLSQLRRGLGDLPLRQLTSDAILAHARRRREAGAGPVTIGLELSLLGSILRSAAGLLGAHLTDEPIKAARVSLKNAGLLGRSVERTRRVDQKTLGVLCAHFRNKARQIVPCAEITEFGVATGMRLGEIVRIRWADLDGRTVLIRDRKDPRRKLGNHERVPLLAVSGYDALAIIQRQPRVDDRIFPYSASTVSTVFARACGALDIVDLRFHDLRHEALSRMFEAGMAIEEVAVLSGHKDWKTLKRYTHLRPEDLARKYAP